MSKAVLISVRPEWCEKIASGEKTIEVRKTRPKLPTPFKCYIYCTNPRHYVDSRHWLSYPAKPLWITANKDVKSNQERGDGDCILLNGKVIGEFVCDGAIPMSIKYSNPDSCLALKEFPYTCMTDKQIIDYLGNGGDGYGWHISELQIYDKPKELIEFKSWVKPFTWDFPEPITRPPQSFCYVED